MDFSIPDDVQKALRLIRDEVKNQAARSYLDAVGDAIVIGEEHGLKLQILYILNNLSGWRGDNARWAKKVLRDYTGELRK